MGSIAPLHRVRLVTSVVSVQSVNEGARRG